MTTRREFIKHAGAAATMVAAGPLSYAKMIPSSRQKQLRLSLAQWSLNRAFFGGSLDPVSFAKIASQDYGILAVEYVNGFYKGKGGDEKFWREMNERASEVGVKNLLIMVDEEGDLGVKDDGVRKKSVENHFKWVNAAKLMNCHSIRVNAFGDGSKSEIKEALIDGLGQLAEYGASQEINILIENHGLQSSDGKFIVEVIEKVNNPFLGTLPDFGNWCLSAKWGSTQDGSCENVYDIYQGVTDFLPYAKGVSAKSYNFNKAGENTLIDYTRMLEIVKKSDFDGFIGIEYEGTELGEPEGIRATKKLLEKTWAKI